MTNTLNCVIILKDLLIGNKELLKLKKVKWVLYPPKIKELNIKNIWKTLI